MQVLSTRPAKVRRPKVTCVTHDSVTLRWQFSPLFLKVRHSKLVCTYKQRTSYQHAFLKLDYAVMS